MTADPLSLTISCVSLALSQIALIEKVFGWTPRVRRAAQPVVKMVTRFACRGTAFVLISLMDDSSFQAGG